MKLITMASHKEQILSRAKGHTSRDDNTTNIGGETDGNQEDSSLKSRKDSSMSRSERKRCQEKRRRHEFKEVMDKLLSILLQYDEDFLAESKQRESLLATRRVTNRHVGSSADSDNGLFNRIELVNQASFTIKRLAKENCEYKEIIEGLRTGRKPIPGELSSSQRREKRASYHRGVGPVALESQPTTLNPTSNNESIDKSNNRANLLTNLQMISAMQQRRQLLESSLTSDAQALASLSAPNPENHATMNFPLIAAMKQKQQQQQQRENMQLIQQMYLEQQRRGLLESQLIGAIPSMVTSSMHQNLGQSNRASAIENQAHYPQSPESLLMHMNNIRDTNFDT